MRRCQRVAQSKVYPSLSQEEWTYQSDTFHVSKLMNLCLLPSWGQIILHHRFCQQGNSKGLNFSHSHYFDGDSPNNRVAMSWLFWLSHKEVYLKIIRGCWWSSPGISRRPCSSLFHLHIGHTVLVWHHDLPLSIFGSIEQIDSWINNFYKEFILGLISQ